MKMDFQAYTRKNEQLDQCCQQLVVMLPCQQLLSRVNCFTSHFEMTLWVVKMTLLRGSK